MRVIVGKTALELARGDITDLSVDCLVNAANSHLKLGGGVAGAIRRKGGPTIQEECDEIVSKRGEVPAGEVAITGGGSLEARYAIHAVGPVLGEADEDAKLRDATINTLELADGHQLKSIAFPAISTGHFGLPKKRCAEVMLPAAISYIRGGTQIGRVVFCLYDQETFDIFIETLLRI